MSEVDNSRNNKRVVLVCAGVTLGMLGMSYAAVPLYQMFCQVTGYAGTTQRAEETTGIVLDQQIKVHFDANVSMSLDWEFKPEARAINLKIGEKGTVNYLASNLGAETSFGTATFNVSPQQAGAYFNKIECFCFTEQKLKAGESQKMPVVFFVDPDIVNDPLLKNVKTITLSYTFYPDPDGTEKISRRDDGEKTKSKL